MAQKKIDSLKHNVEGIKQVTGGILKVNVGKKVILLKISEFMNGCLGGHQCRLQIYLQLLSFLSSPKCLLLAIKLQYISPKSSYIGARDQPWLLT